MKRIDGNGKRDCDTGICRVRKMRRLRRRRRRLTLLIFLVLLIPAGVTVLYLNLFPVFLKNRAAGNETAGRLGVIGNVRPGFRKKPGEFFKKQEDTLKETELTQVKAGKDTGITGTEARKEKVVYLTFDDGPSANTEKVLDILKKENVKATFFVTGNNPKYNHLMKRAKEEGHAIGLHTYTHDYSKVYSSEEAYFDDLQNISDLVEKVTGEKTKILRFPGGSSNLVSAKYTKGIMSSLTKRVKEKGYQYFDWNCDSTDAAGNNVPVERLVKNASSGQGEQINVLMHDTDAKDTTVEALPQIIKSYRSRGYVFQALTEKSFAPRHKVNN